MSWPAPAGSPASIVTSRRCWRAWLGLALLAAAAACANDHGAQAGSQTHFLMACSQPEECPGPYSCLCGVCTMDCNSSGECLADDAPAKCLPAVPDSASCGAGLQVCDIACER